MLFIAVFLLSYIILIYKECEVIGQRFEIKPYTILYVVWNCNLITTVHEPPWKIYQVTTLWGETVNLMVISWRVPTESAICDRWMAKFLFKKLKSKASHKFVQWHLYGNRMTPASAHLEKVATCNCSQFRNIVPHRMHGNEKLYSILPQWFPVPLLTWVKDRWFGTYKTRSSNQQTSALWSPSICYS